ncbi:Aminotransferase/transcriptional regulator, GntR family [Shewanella piezotolerans WP3]|uniref:Aminotransferase/transcriptional regulator, GntR family n=1 Tax=Shewanella piezotolerans (strain WP3 / JCM 13877) TaxID=225849 RepID=B8CV20_SHEPW|nr:PLP-dependent aminotransferase family protein [Shewanella piezotolerans]ACJ31496.1 Aminotransferase/transcriptional regulator, GntR family [Shewanella piezotolerans WP3]
MAVFKYRKIVDEITTAIELGQLTGKLMSVRALAKQKKLGVSTVVQAYHELERLGWIVAKPKRGYFVISTVRAKPPNYGRQINRVLAGLSLDKAVQYSFNDNDILPLSCTAPSTVIDPEQLLGQLHKKALAKRPYKLWMQDPIEGVSEFRLAICQHLSRSQQHFRYDQLLITNGRQEGLLLALIAAKALNRPIAVESPMSFYFQTMLKQFNAEVVEIPMQADYRDELALMSTAYNSQAFATYLVNPNFADPTGRVLSVSEKELLIEWAEQRDVTLIEYDRGELHFDNERPVTIASLVKEQSSCRVICIADFYDTISPSISLGYLVCINSFDECQFAKQTVAEEPSIVLQYMLQQMMQSGRYQKHLRHLRNQLKQNYTATIALLRPHLAAINTEQLYISQPAGGPCIWFKLPNNLSSHVLWHKMVEKKLSIAPGAMFTLGEGYDNFFRVTFALPWNESMIKGISLLGEIVAEFIAEQDKCKTIE